MTDKSNHISEGIHMFHTTHLSRRVYTLYLYSPHTVIDSGGQRTSKIYASFLEITFLREMVREVHDKIKEMVSFGLKERAPKDKMSYCLRFVSYCILLARDVDKIFISALNLV